MNINTKLLRLVNETKQDMVRAGVPFNICAPITINNRLTSTLGKCRYNRITGIVKIEISPIVINCSDNDKIKNVICHELIHSANQCLMHGHQGMWAVFANKMNTNDKRYHITTTTSDFTSEPSMIQKYKYTVRCQHCGAQQSFTKETKIIKAMKHTTKYAIECRKCHHHDFELITLK